MTKLTSYTIARKNIQRRPVRNFCLILAQIILAAFLFVGTVLIFSLSNGAQNISDKLGADIMIVPAGYDPHIDNILLTGKPSAFYLPENSLEAVKALDIQSIEKITPQIFMATLKASCCAYPVQIMGIDYESDFIVQTWLDSSVRKLNDGEVILGFHSTGNIGDDIIFFGENLKIVGRLERTGMGFDSCVFMNRQTIINLANAADKIRSQKLAQNNNLISVIMLKLKPGSDTALTARELNKNLNNVGMYALFSKRFVSNISSSLILVSHIIKYCLIIIWILAIIIIGLLFSVIMNERKKEFGILRVIGASRKKLIIMLMHEALIISMFGSITGIISGAIIIIAGSPIVNAMLNLPFLMPSGLTIILTALTSGFITILTGLFASGIFAFKAGREEIYENLS